MTTRDAAYFDSWYQDMVGSSAADEITRRVLGLPARMQSTSLLGWDALAEVVTALDVTDGQVLLDLACGRGGYGLEIARRTGARVLGLDFSSVAIGQATHRALAMNMAERADFRVGELTRTGLAAASVDAVLVVDAIQFAASVLDALRECRRVLVPGGRLVITCWETVDASDERVPESLRQLDFARQLPLAGLTHVEVADRPVWREIERALWQEAVTIDPGDDPALLSLHTEGRRRLDTFDAARRVLVTARAPDRPER
jgi:SAM-dependent methyltransferase